MCLLLFSVNFSHVWEEGEGLEKYIYITRRIPGSFCSNTNSWCGLRWRRERNSSTAEPMFWGWTITTSPAQCLSTLNNNFSAGVCIIRSFLHYTVWLLAVVPYFWALDIKSDQSNILKMGWWGKTIVGDQSCRKRVLSRGNGGWRRWRRFSPDSATFLNKRDLVPWWESTYVKDQIYKIWCVCVWGCDWSCDFNWGYRTLSLMGSIPGGRGRRDNSFSHSCCSQGSMTASGLGRKEEEERREKE